MAMEIEQQTGPRFSSRLGLILSALGIAVGTGNIWRFPRIVAQSGGENGAGAFLIAWFLFLFIWSIPLIIAEYSAGKRYGKGIISVFISGMGKRFGWLGAFVAFVPLGITFFYSVIVGWCIYYFAYMLTNPLPQTYESAMIIWDNYQSGYIPLVTHLVAVCFAAWAIWKGVSSIEKVNKVLIPSLLVIILISVVRAITLPGSGAGIAYLFRTDWSQLKDPVIWLNALTQNAWDTGAGWGLFMTYAAYMKKEHGSVNNAFITGIGNNTISILAGLMVFGTLFAVLGHDMGMQQDSILEIMKTSGPASTGLTFIWMPQLFSRMFGGPVLAIIFFLGLTFAGFSSLIAMFELPSRVMIDAGMSRKRAILTVSFLVLIVGFPHAKNLNLLSNQDFVWGVALMISGALIALLIVKQGVNEVREEINSVPGDFKIGKWWIYSMRFVVPLAAVVLLGWWLSQSFIPGKWYNPFAQYSFMSCLFQWMIMAGFFLVINRQITRIFTKGEK